MNTQNKSIFFHLVYTSSKPVKEPETPNQVTLSLAKIKRNSGRGLEYAKQNSPEETRVCATSALKTSI